MNQVNQVRSVLTLELVAIVCDPWVHGVVRTILMLDHIRLLVITTTSLVLLERPLADLSNDQRVRTAPVGRTIRSDQVLWVVRVVDSPITPLVHGIVSLTVTKRYLVVDLSALTWLELHGLAGIWLVQRASLDLAVRSEERRVVTVGVGG